MSPSVAVVIPNWNGARLLPSCISALAGQTYRKFRLFLVDNGSQDGSVQLVEELDGRRTAGWVDGELPYTTQVIRNGTNLGFAEANNQAFRAAIAEGSRFIATLNNDAVAHPRWLEGLVEAIGGSAPQVGMVASVMLFSHRPERVASAGISVHRDGVALDSALGMQVSEVDRRGVHPVFGPSAGAALYSTAMLRDVGLFDSSFFSYLEDADLAWRARARGWKAVVAPEARVLHEYSVTGGQGSAFKNRLVARNRVWLLYKNMPTTLLIRYAPAIVRYDIAGMAAAAAAGNREALMGRLEGIRRLRDFTKDRRVNAASVRVHPEEMDALLARALSPLGHSRYRRKLTYLLGV